MIGMFGFKDAAFCYSCKCFGAYCIFSSVLFRHVHYFFNCSDTNLGM